MRASNQSIKLYLEAFKDKKPKSISEILEALYPCQYFKATQTYRERECFSNQCSANRNRSIDDIYYLCKSYFPNITIKDLMHEILTYTKYDKILAFSNCSTINRITVFGYDYQQLKSAWKNTYITMITHNHYSSEWNQRELFELLNIHSEEDLDNYRAKYGIKID